MELRRVCVFCGSSHGAQREYSQAARRMGKLLAQRGLGLVYGGGAVGLMGEVADGALSAGGEVIGVIPDALMVRELGHSGITDLRVVKSMHERKALMADLSDAFIALPGGFGTFEEFFEVVTWAQLGMHRKPCALLNVAGFFDPLLAFLDHATEDQFIRPEHRKMILVDCDPVKLLDGLRTFVPPKVPKWIGRERV